MAEYDLNTSLFLLKALEDNLEILSKNIIESERIIANMRRDWIALQSKQRNLKDEMERDSKLQK